MKNTGHTSAQYYIVIVELLCIKMFVSGILKNSGTHICEVSQFNLQVGLGCFQLRPHSHSDNLGVYNCVVPDTNTNAQKLYKRYEHLRWKYTENLDIFEEKKTT